MLSYYPTKQNSKQNLSEEIMKETINKENITVLNINTPNSGTIHLIKSNYRLEDTN